MSQETYIPVECPGPRSGEGCGRYLTKIAFTHHDLFVLKCPLCGAQWRIFHNSNNVQVEMTLTEHVAEHQEPVVKLVTWGKFVSPPKPAMA